MHVTCLALLTLQMCMIPQIVCYYVSKQSELHFLLVLELVNSGYFEKHDFIFFWIYNQTK